MGAWAVIALLVVLLSGCDVSTYAFRVDDSIRITAPEARTTVELPVTVRWADQRPPADPEVDLDDPAAEYYAVFVDRAPIGPRQTLAAVADDPEVCEQVPGCPSETMLRDRRVFLTADRQVTIEFLPDLRPGGRGTDTHELTVVRMRGDRRVDEAAWSLTFFVDR